MKTFTKLSLFLALIGFLSSQAQTTVVDIIVNSEDHNTLETAVIAADLATTLSGSGPFTVFAPTDSAFAALPDGTLDNLLADTGQLKDILFYHVLSDSVQSGDLMDGQSPTTLLGKDVAVTIRNDSVFINDALVTMADLVADNGVIHVIDAVLLPPRVSVVDVIVNSEVHNTLEAAVLAAGLADTLDSAGPFTVFAPTDDAFEALPEGALDALLADPAGALTDILLYHVLGSENRSTDLSDGQTVTTLAGEDISIAIRNDSVFINDALVTMADILTDNGVVHVIDAVLMNTTTTVVDIITNSEDHMTLEAAVVAADLVETLSGDGPFTVFAPTDDAFALLPNGILDTLLADPSGELTNILLYHVVNGQALSSELVDGDSITTLLNEDVIVRISNDSVFINDALVTGVDIITDNGVVHVIDAVLLPPAPTTVVDVIVNSEDHMTLEAAVVAANLVETLSGEGPFTVFAPTDDAFALLPEGVLESLLVDPSGQLTNILLYHVVNGQALSSELVDGDSITTLLNEDVIVRISNDSVFINEALVTGADIITDNGVVHVIDAVLLPPAQTTIVDVVVNSEIHNTLEAAVIAADLAETLSGEGPFTLFAPTDAAFDALPSGTLDTLLMDPSGALTNILLYHVLGEDVRSTDLSDGQSATTLLSQDISISISNDTVFINDIAMVVSADIVTDNGVVHVIDAVLLPSTTTSTVFLDNSLVDVQVFPNPSSKEVFINVLESGLNFDRVRVINMQGSTVMERDLMGSQYRLKVDRLVHGQYILQLINDQQVFQHKILVQP